jgi:hypothetical protein
MEISKQIDNYINGLMEKEERKRFESLIAENKHLSAAVKIRQELLSFAATHQQKIETVVHQEDLFLDEMTLDEWDLPANRPLVEIIRKITFYAEDIQAEYAHRKGNPPFEKECTENSQRFFGHRRFRGRLSLQKTPKPSTA